LRCLLIFFEFVIILSYLKQSDASNVSLILAASYFC
jgi:hypothetical protein